MAKDAIVYQANPLIEGRRDFSLIETRLFYIGLRDLVPKLPDRGNGWKVSANEDFPATTIKPKELVEIFGNRKYYSTLREICKDFSKKSVEVRRGEGFAFYPLFAELSYTPEDGLRLEFNPKMEPWLLQLAEMPFTRIPFEQVWALRSPHSVRLLELLLQCQNTKTHERTLAVEELKERLGIPGDAYRDRLNNFKKFVVEKAVREINEKTRFKVECISVRDGRRISSFKFVLYMPEDAARAELGRRLAKLREGMAWQGKE